MRVIVFGATGMVGQGVLRECFLDPGVESVLAIGRSASEKQHEKLHDRVLGDLTDLSTVEKELSGYDACFFCLGVSAAGMTEGFIQPLHGIVSKTKLYRAIYAVMGPLYPVLNALIPGYVTTTEQVGRAMLAVARHGAPKAILENRDINALAAARDEKQGGKEERS
jgi:hypothetical protein